MACDHHNVGTQLEHWIEALGNLVGNLNGCTLWCRYVPLSLESVHWHSVYSIRVSGLYQGNRHSGKNRNRTMESAVLLDVESALIIHALRGNDIIWQFVHSHAYDVRYELKIDTRLVNCNGPVSPEKSDVSHPAPGIEHCSWQVRDSGTGTMGTSSK